MYFNLTEDVIPLLPKIEGKVYVLIIVLRKKDGHKKDAVFTSIMFKDADDLIEHKLDNVIRVCETLKARAYLYFTPIDLHKLGYHMIHAITGFLQANQLNGLLKITRLDHYVSMFKSTHWVIDIDSGEQFDAVDVANKLRTNPELNEAYITAQATPNGMHMIVKPFNKSIISNFMGEAYSTYYLINEYNALLLYYPDSLI
jgi:hypothetical protein